MKKLRIKTSVKASARPRPVPLYGIVPQPLYGVIALYGVEPAPVQPLYGVAVDD